MIETEYVFKIGYYIFSYLIEIMLTLSNIFRMVYYLYTIISNNMWIFMFYIINIV